MGVQLCCYRWQDYFRPDNSVLLPSWNVVENAAAVRDLLLDTKRRQALGRAARQFVVDHFEGTTRAAVVTKRLRYDC